MTSPEPPPVGPHQALPEPPSAGPDEALAESPPAGPHPAPPEPATAGRVAATAEFEPSLGRFARAHRRGVTAAGAAVLILVIVSVLTAVTSGTSTAALADATTCTQWRGSDQALKLAYGHLYLREYRTFADTAADATAIATQLNRACTHAAYLGESDDISLVAAMHKAF